MTVTFTYPDLDHSKRRAKIELNDVRSIREDENDWRFHLKDGVHRRFEKKGVRMLRLTG